MHTRAMNRSQHVAPTAHWFGEHRLDSATASRHRNVDETPLIIALGFTVLVVAIYRPDAESTLVEYDRCPPPAYSSPASPSDQISSPASAPPNRDMRVSGTHETTFSGPDSSLAAVPWKPAERKDFPLSLSQPRITEISSALYRTLSSPGRYTANHNFSKLALYTPRSTFSYGTYTASVDQFGRMVIPHLSIPEQTTPSDSIATISPCAMVSTAEDTSHAEFVPSHSDNSSDHACDDPYDLNTVLAKEYIASDGGREPKWTPIHEANQIGTNTMEISA